MTRMALWDRLMSTFYLARSMEDAQLPAAVLEWLVTADSPAAAALPASYFATMCHFVKNEFPAGIASVMTITDDCDPSELLLVRDQASAGVLFISCWFPYM